MELIVLNDELFNLIPVTKEMLKDIKLLVKVDCFDLCDIIRQTLTTYLDSPINMYEMKDDSGYLYGCICN
jgi:hypothetical protein